MSQQEFSEKMPGWIRTNRTLRGLTKAKLAKAIGTSWASIDGWEKGKFLPSAYFHLRLRKFFKDHPAPATTKKAEVKA